jgi:leader peptidase (prepilin peptidase) / N-methyltransferase
VPEATARETRGPHMTPLYTAFLVSLGLFGLVFGSFANVVIWRVPRKESVVSPGSRCPQCGHDIRWYDNVPLVSWMVLRGRCRDCGAAISARYPLVEALSGLLWLLAGIAFGISLATAFCIALFYTLLILAFIDLDVQRLPNVLVLWLVGFGVAGVLISQFTGVRAAPLVGVASTGAFATPLAAAALGVALGAGLSGLTAWVYGLVRRRAGLGMGDVKLLGAMGLFLGPYVLVALLFGSVFGAVYGLACAACRKSSVAAMRIPFGPFLALGGVCATLAGPAALHWYLTLVGVA